MIIIFEQVHYAIFLQLSLELVEQLLLKSRPVAPYQQVGPCRDQGEQGPQGD